MGIIEQCACLIVLLVGIIGLSCSQQYAPPTATNINPHTLRYLQQMLRRSGITPNSKLSVTPVSTKPMIVKPMYGRAQLQNGDGSTGSYRFAQPTGKGMTPSKLAETLKPVLMALPNLGNLLYKYAKKRIEAKQQQPMYQDNIYRNMFGQNTYGPMPMPSSYQPQPVMMTNMYAAQQQQQQQSGYGMQPAQQVSGYQQQAQQMQQPLYGQQQQQQTRKAVTIENPGWGGSIYISGPAGGMADLLQNMNNKGSSKPSFTSYNNGQAVMASYGGSGGMSYGNMQTTGYNKGPVCPQAPAKFCGYREAGHYAHPSTNQCFLQCDAFGRGFEKACAPGTYWKNGGPEPAMFNKCA